MLDSAGFALVMATGIVSTALRFDGVTTVSACLLGVGLACYATLLAIHGRRLLSRRPRSSSGLVAPGVFRSLTFVAGSDVLSARLAMDGHLWSAAVLLGIGTVAWLLLGYSAPISLVASRRRPRLSQMDGSWFLWTVGTQSVASALAALAHLVPGDAAALAVGASACWAVGVMQYLLTASLVPVRLLLRPVTAANLVPSSWVFMGSAAITVLAGAEILRLPAADDLLPGAFTSGLSLVLWSFCTWLIPLLLALGVWRHLLRRVPLRYDAGLWSMVFPVGMYGAASHELGLATGFPWLTEWGGSESRAAAVVWAAVFLAALVAAGRAGGGLRGGLAPS